MPLGTGLKSVLARDRFDKEAALNLSSHSRGASGRLRGSAARHNGARAFLRRLMLLPSRLKLRRASQTVRSLASSRPYLVWMSIGATACLGVWLLVIGFQLVLTPFCGNSREMLCALSAKRGGRSLPELMSEGELAADGGESMLKAVGLDVNAPDVGSGWQLAHATPPAASRTEARIAYFIQVGADSVALLPRLFRRLHHPDNVYVVHIDAKVGASDHESAQSLVHASGAYRKNIHFLPSEMITYKGVSMVVNTIAGMTLARRVDPDWDYFVNLSGADYPLLTPTDQRRLLARPGVAPGRLNFMSFFPKHEWAPYAFRVKYQYWDPAVVGYENPKSRVRRMKSMRLNPLEHLRLYTFVKAEAWMILSRQFCDFIVRSDFAKKMLLNHAHVLSAPEHYFADVLYNHPTWKKTLVPDAFRKVVWHHKKHRSGQHPYVLDKPENPPFEFWMYLKDTRSLFARKFSTPDSALQDRIDVELSGAEPPPPDHPNATEKLADSAKRFYANLVSHFDTLTQETLMTQTHEWPSHAYPPL